MAARVVGWASKSEWIQIYQELYSDDPVQIQHALDRTTAWKSRLDTKMPIAIDCTSSLAAVSLRDCGAHVRGEGESSTPDCHGLFQLRLAYSMALARFVNLVTDASQDKFYIQPVHVMAKEVALPEWMVTLRHEATHRSLPALPVLRSGARFALSWLRQRYWEPQLQQCGELPGSTPEQEDLDDDEVRQAVAGLLISFEKHQFEILSETTTKKQRNHHTGLLQEVLNNLSALLTSNSDIVVECLCGQGFLLPTHEQKSALGITNVFPDNEETELPCIDKKFQDFWKPVFELLHQSNNIPPLLERLIQQLGTYTDEDLEFAVGWIALITTARESQDKRSLEKVLYKVKGQLPWRRLITCCLATPCRHTTSLVHRMLREADPPISQREQETYDRLWTIFAGNASPPDRPVPDAVFTVDMVEARFQGTQERWEGSQEDPMECSEEGSQRPYKAWEICKDKINWSQLPLGCAPNHTDDFNYLEVALGDNQGIRVTHKKQETLLRSRVLTHVRPDVIASPFPDQEHDVQQGQDWTPMELGMLKRTVVLF